jgi:hypothetical protein
VRNPYTVVVSVTNIAEKNPKLPVVTREMVNSRAQLTNVQKPVTVYQNASVIKEEKVFEHEEMVSLSSNIFVSKSKLDQIYSRKPVEYIIKLAEVVFGTTELERVAKKGDVNHMVERLDKKKMNALTSKLQIIKNAPIRYKKNSVCTMPAGVKIIL